MTEPAPTEIYTRATSEGERRLSMPPLEQVSTGFIAGVTIVFGIIALAVSQHLVEPALGTGLGKLAGALAFGIGLVFLITGRSELFTENFFGPVAAAIERRQGFAWVRLVRLWAIILVLNLLGGAVMTAVFVVEGALPSGAHEVLTKVAEEINGKSGLATFMRAIAAGTLLTLLSYLLHAVNSAASRIILAYFAGVFLALGPFDHVVVTALHLLAGMWLGAEVTYQELGMHILLVAAGNLVGGLLLMTLTHTAQVKGAGKD
ncbi:formate/nitrite transporter family protein [Pseudarthrobacter sp. NamE5]|uniref:formate/nitrite transporter family protein n=1 Tax=Pseudarthrobacter sp. NamE5 TaxID=2576839 RepID=UPI00110B5077|nr:formate/nitrite transporter family protein [Pseudarthrobacter sp. NamE5]TLM84712.1 formate/nitrite transporter family protein [Pseudarthrobacter sp. NamE5]